MTTASCLLCWAVCVLRLSMQVHADDEANGYNVIRIENEYKLRVPDDQLDAVWKFLESTYDNKRLWLRRFDDGFSTAVAEEYFTDLYFDNGSLALLKGENGIRHRTRLVPGNPDHPKHGRQLMQIKMHRPGDAVVNRSELKFKTQPVKLSRNRLDMHPAIGLVDSDQRIDFVQAVRALGVDPFQLHNTITLNQRRRRVYISLHRQPFATITLDEVTSHRWWYDIRFVEIELELNEISYTEGSAERRALMENINEELKQNLLEAFPQITQDQTPKYNKAYNRLGKRFHWLPVALRLDMPAELPIGLLTGFSVVVGITFSRRRRLPASGRNAPPLTGASQG